MASTTATKSLPGAAITAETPWKPVWRSLKVILTYAVLIAFALAFIMPFVYTIVNSLKTSPDINANPQLLYPTQGWTTAGYEKVLGTDQLNFVRVLFNSFAFAIITMLGHLIFDSMAGYALARIQFPGRGLAFAALIGTMMVPGIVLLIPRFLILRQLSLVNTFPGLVLPTIADAFGVFLMKQFFESLPIDIEEAAFIDGASRFRMFFIVILPMAVPALTALAIFGFQGAWNDFTGPLISVGTNKDLYTLPLALAFLRGQTGDALQWDLLLPGSVITTLPMAIIFFVFQRFFVEGVTYTGIKG
jgi:multiple sugar transport system permease protein